MTKSRSSKQQSSNAGVVVEAQEIDQDGVTHWAMEQNPLFVVGPDGHQQRIQMQMSDGSSAPVFVSHFAHDIADSVKKSILAPSEKNWCELLDESILIDTKKYYSLPPILAGMMSDAEHGVGRGVFCKNALRKLYERMEDDSMCRFHTLGHNTSYVVIISANNKILCSYISEGNGELRLIKAPTGVKKDSKRSVRERMPRVEPDMRDIQSEVRSGLKPAEMAERMGVTPATINNKRREHHLLGLPQANRFVYPAWQLDESGQPVNEWGSILKCLFELSENPIDVLDLIISKRDFYGGLSIKDLLLAGRIDDAIAAARKSAGEF